MAKQLHMAVLQLFFQKRKKKLHVDLGIVQGILLDYSSLLDSRLNSIDIYTNWASSFEYLIIISML